MDYEFSKARSLWYAAEPIRRMRHNLKNFTYGKQWETLASRSGVRPTVYESMMLAGNSMPHNNNLIRPLVKSIVGRFRLNLAEEAPLEGKAAELRDANMLDELDTRTLEEFLISGCAIQRLVYERRLAGLRMWVDAVNPDHFFCNRFEDPRGNDIRTAGMLHEMSMPEICLRFAHGSRKRTRELERIFQTARMSPSTEPGLLALTQADTIPTQFSVPTDPGLHRVVEVWTLDLVGHRKPTWVGRFYAADGTLVDQTTSMFPVSSHPFVVTFYPLTDGEIHPFIEDVIDQQRHINLLISTIDKILMHSSKGALLLPVECQVKGHELYEMAKLWSRPGAVIPYTASRGYEPKEVNSTTRHEGAYQLLELEMRLFQQISGVSGALQGQTGGNQMSASLYEAQATNSAVALQDVFQTFNSFRRVRTEKALAVLR